MTLVSKVFSGVSSIGPNVIFSINGPTGANVMRSNPSIITTTWTANTTLNGDVNIGSSISGAVFQGSAITSSTTLTTSQSGSWFSVSQGSTTTITLPSPAAGLNYKFFLGVTGTSNVTVTGPSSTLIGTITDPAGVISIGAGATSLTFVFASAMLGDVIEVYGNGSFWVCKAISGAPGGIVLTP